MERSIIESMVASLPVSELGSIAEDHEIWEETDGAAHFKVTRHILPTPDRVIHEMVSLTISGPPEEKLRILNEFKQVLGRPTVADMTDDEAMDTIAWLLR